MIGVKGHQFSGQGLYHFGRDCTLSQQILQRTLVRQTAHFEHIFDDLAVLPKSIVLMILEEGHDLEIDPSAEPTVQTKFLRTVEMTPLQAREIEKSQVDGFFRFVDETISQKNQG